MGGTNGFRGCGAGVRVAGAIREGVRVAGAIRKDARVAGAIRKGASPSGAMSSKRRCAGCAVRRVER